MFGLVLQTASGVRRRARKVQEFTRLLAALLKSGLNEVQALSAILAEMPNGRFTSVLDDVLHGIERGVPLSNRLEDHPAYFNASYVGMVRVGETCGTLGETLTNLVELERTSTFAADKLALAVVLPALLLFCMLFPAALMARVIGPRLSEIGVAYWGLSTDPAAMTSGLASWIRANPMALWLLGVGAAVALTIVFDFVYHRPARKSLVLSRFAASLKAMLRANLPLEQVQYATAGLSPSPRYTAAVHDVFRQLQAGRSFTDAFAGAPYFPETFRWLVAGGEHRGALDDSLEDAAGFYAWRADAKLSRMLNMMPAMVTICLGVVVGLLTYSFFSMIVALINGLL
jgi:type II secretory pathway component PulF